MADAVIVEQLGEQLLPLPAHVDPKVLEPCAHDQVRGGGKGRKAEDPKAGAKAQGQDQKDHEPQDQAGKDKDLAAALAFDPEGQVQHGGKGAGARFFKRPVACKAFLYAL